MGKDDAENKSLLESEKGSEKKDKGDKGDKGGKEKKAVSKWPYFSKCKVGKTTLQGALAACFRLEASQNMPFHARMGYAVAIVIQLITQTAQVFILFIFNAATANAMLATFSPGAVKTMVEGIKAALVTPQGGAGAQPGGAPLATATQCAMQQTHPWLGYLMMFIWYSLVIKEFMDCVFLMRLVAWFPASKPKDPSKGKAEKSKDPNKELENDSFKIMGKDKDKIDHMPFRWKLFALIFLLIPHCGCLVFVGYAGMKFLAMTGAPGRLIMKAMGLRFILSFDKLFYAAFASEQFDKYVKKSKFLWIRPQERNYFNSWLSTLFKGIVVLILTGLSWTQFKHMLKLRHYCRLYLESFPENCLGDTCGMSFGLR